MLPIRGQGCYREGATATISVYDRRGRRRSRVPGTDARIRPGDLVGAIDGLDRGGVAGLDRANAKIRTSPKWGVHPDSMYPPGARRRMASSPPGRRLKWQWVMDPYHASEYVADWPRPSSPMPGRGSSWARKMGRWLKEKPRGIYRVLRSAAALRRRRIIMSAAKRERSARPTPTCGSGCAGSVSRLPSGSPADRQRGNGSGVQDGVHPAAEAVGDDLEGGRGPTDRQPARDPLEWGVERGVSILPGIERDTADGDSRDYSEEEALKGRVIVGTGATAPNTNPMPAILPAHGEVWIPDEFSGAESCHRGRGKQKYVKLPCRQAFEGLLAQAWILICLRILAVTDAAPGHTNLRVAK